MQHLGGFKRSLTLVAAPGVVTMAIATVGANGQSDCLVHTEQFNSFLGPQGFNNGTVRIEWCTDGASIASSSFCPTGNALKLDSSNEDPILWVHFGNSGCTAVKIQFDYSQFSPTGTLLRTGFANDLSPNCNASVPNVVGSMTTTGGICTTVTHTVFPGMYQSIYWQFDHGTPTSNAIFIDNVSITVTGCCGSSNHDCCSIGGAGCLDATIQSCVCALDPFCCNVAWDAQCVAEVNAFACGNCGNNSGCSSSFSANFGNFFQTGTVCARFPELFEHCEGTGPFLTSSTACGGTGDYVMSMAGGFPLSAAITRCLDFSFATNPLLTFTWTKNANTLGSRVEVSAGGGAWQTVWTAPFAAGGTCATQTVNLASYAGQPSIQLKFSSGSSVANGAAFDDIFIELNAQNDCCDFGSSPGCADQSVQNCVCAIDPFCCEVEWDDLCVISVEYYQCGDCGFCEERFHADFGTTFLSGSVCSRFPDQFIVCDGPGPYITSGSACGGVGDYAMSLPATTAGSPPSAAIIRCLNLVQETSASLRFTFAKENGKPGPIVEASGDAGLSWVTLWTAPESPGSGCHAACVDLASAVGLPFVLFRLSANTNLPGVMTIDDIALVSGEGCDSCSIPVIDAGFDRLILPSQTIQLNGSVIGGSGGTCPSVHLPQWTGPGVLSGENSLTPFVNQPGTYSLAASCDECTGMDFVEVRLRIVGDANGDGFVSMADISMVISAFGTTCPPATEPCGADINGDGVISIADITLTLSNFGKTGP